MITALILAAGQSKRMGQPKMLLPWGKTTVLGQVINTFRAAGVEDLLVITGGAREQVEALVGDSAQTLFNPNCAEGEMLSSIQTGLRALLKPPPSPRDTSPKSALAQESETSKGGGFGRGREGVAALIGLGDQPQVQVSSVRLVVEEYMKSGASLIVPSFQMRRGHPWLVAGLHWDEILYMRSPESPRDFLNRHTYEICYVEVDDPGILKDLDTPEDYLKSKP